MTRANAKWIRLMAVIGCTTMWMASCKHAPDAQMKASYATMKVSTANKELTTPLFGHDPRSPGYRHLSASIGNDRKALCNRRRGRTERTITFCYRPSSLQSCFKDSPGKCGSGKSSFSYSRTELQQY